MLVRRAASRRAFAAGRALLAAHSSHSQRLAFARGNAALATSHPSEPQHHPELVQAHEHHKHEHRPDEQSADTPRARYHQLVVHGTLREDSHQMQIIDRLERLHRQLASYNPPEIPPIETHSSFFFRLLNPNGNRVVSVAEDKMPRGLYLYGDVGTGKSMLMDLFYNTLPPNIKRKRRVHFHAFMIDVHKRVHALKVKHGDTGIEDPILLVARDLANEASVLCLDEFQVTDIVDAMILRRLMECLLQFGVVSVMTSNRHPDDLYKNGIQRSSFIPTIDLLKTRYDVVDLGQGIDYRRVPRALSHVYFFPLSEANRREIDKIFEALTSDSNDLPIRNRPLRIWGRDLVVPESTSTVAKFSFKQLCGQPLSAADYLEVTRTFRTVFVTDVPKMGLNQKDMARRFITFIDACYESRTKLFTSSEVPIYQVFSDEASGNAGGVTDHMRSVMDDLGLNEQVIGTTSMFTGEEELFAFARACSRLVQMGTKEWAELTSDAHDSEDEQEYKQHH
ncbi:AFG1-like ATPase [Exidia glandulosa HHB12029]|uniref:AFG1-like ATPase n=1 Tax=Exidia glandulosa HHB12029 TaxID=1314781 RepID=A0A165R1J6_EXIGL|nr:AFG1-like ATPase [Exidia glandulosa HHB12029]